MRIINYYLRKYVGKYRVKAEIDKNTNDFCRNENGELENNLDIYIECFKGIKVFHYGKDILEAYIPSKGRGRKIIKQIRNINENIIFDIIETDSEVLFKFRDKNSNIVIPIMRPKISGSKISPFSSKNLPKNKYEIPDNDLNKYKTIVSKIPKEQVLIITHITNEFIKSLATKKYTLNNIKADIKLSGLKGKEFIHSIGKWDIYIEYLSNRIIELNF